MQWTYSRYWKQGIELRGKSKHELTFSSLLACPMREMFWKSSWLNMASL